MRSPPPTVAEFERLFRAHTPGLLRLARRLLGDPEEARDVVQDLFVRLWAERERWEAAEEARKSYLYTAVRRRALDKLKHRRLVQQHEAKVLADPELFVTRPAPQADVATMDTELATTIARAVATLSPRQRAAFELRFLQQLTTDEVGQVMGISPNTVRVHLERALVALRTALKILLVLAATLGIG